MAWRTVSTSAGNWTSPRYFSNLFRPVVVDLTWLTWEAGTIRHFAEGMYHERAFDRLPVLGDALEGAGCTEQVLLRHLRGFGPHARGCWLLDLLTGRG